MSSQSLNNLHVCAGFYKVRDVRHAAGVEVDFTVLRLLGYPRLLQIFSQIARWMGRNVEQGIGGWFPVGFPPGKLVE